MEPSEPSIGSPPLRVPPAVPYQTVRHHYELVQDRRELDGETTQPEPAVKSMFISETSKDSMSHTSRSKRHGAMLALSWQEIVAAVLLCAAMIASYVTVAPYQGKPLPKRPLKITISALLSTYSVVLRGAASFLIAQGLAQMKWRWFRAASSPLRDLVLHDNATRGAFGAIQLLWRLPLPTTWQWVGCVLAITTLATGPLTQLVLQYESCTVPTGEQGATIPRGQVFFGQGYHQGAATHTLTLAEQLSLNAGIYSLGSIPAECSSGNCTFAPYTSIGYCSACNDTSSELQFSLQHGTYTDIVSFNPTSNLTVNWTSVGGSPTSEVAASKGLEFVLGPPNLKNDSLVNCSENQTWACQGYAAASCCIFPCIRGYSAFVSNAVLQETVVNMWNDSIFGEGLLNNGTTPAWSTINTSCLTTEQSAKLRTLNYTWDSSVPWLAYNGSWSETQSKNSQGKWITIYTPGEPEFEQDLLDSHCLYVMDAQFANGLSLYFGEGPFNGKLVANWVQGGPGVASYSGPQLLLTIYNYGDISMQRTQDIFNNITMSLTNHIRTEPYGVNQTLMVGSGSGLLKTNIPAQGVVYATKTCLQVRWGWLAFPTAVAVLTLLFFAGVLLSSTNLGHDVQTWKTSPLPLLFFGLADTPVTSQDVSDLEDVANSTSVRLVTDTHGNMVFRKQDAI